MITYTEIEKCLDNVNMCIRKGEYETASMLVDDLKNKILDRKKRASQSVLAYRTSSAKQIKLHSLNNRIYDARKRGNSELVEKLVEEKKLLLNGE